MINSLNGSAKEQQLLSQEKKRNRFQQPDMETPHLPKVLMYHRIVDDGSLSGQYDTCLHVRDFEHQLKLINQFGFTPITFQDYRLFLQGKLHLPKKPIILTFDDGYEDFYRLAYPLLKREGMKAVVFVMGDRSLEFNRWDVDSSRALEARLLSDAQINELHAEGFEIGAHTLSHANLTKLNKETSYKEINKSKLILEALLDSPVISFCYPYGSVNSGVKELVKESGYQFACGAYSGPAEFGEDKLEIRRLEINSSTSMWGFLMRLMIPYEYMEWMWWKARKAEN